MVKKELSTALEKNGITKIDSLDKKFDPNLHQAMMEIENTDLDEGIVVQEIQTGYMMHDRLLRPAMVGVSKKPQKASEMETEKELKSINKGSVSRNKSSPLATNEICGLSKDLSLDLVKTPLRLAKK